MNQVSKQDIQGIVDVARNRIIERSVTKQDISMLQEQLKLISNVQQQHQQLLNQAQQQRIMFTRRAESVDARLNTIENEIKNTQVLIGRVLDRMAAQRIQQIVVPAQPDGQTREATHVYRPA